jgi:hypothetical protein
LCDSSGGNAQWAWQDKKRQQKELCTSILRPYQVPPRLEIRIPVEPVR